MVDQPNSPHWLGVDRGASNEKMIEKTRLAIDALSVHDRYNVGELIHPMHALDVARDVLTERARQDQRWGETNHPDAPKGVRYPNAYFGVLNEAAAKLAVEVATNAGRLSYGHILVEEVAEALTAITTTPAELRAELVQVSAVCQKWIETIDRRQATAQESQP